MTRKSFEYRIIYTLRSIFDGKYSEIIYNLGDLNCNTDFPEYVFWWLGEFMIDDKLGKVVPLENKFDEDFYRLEYAK